MRLHLPKTLLSAVLGALSASFVMAAEDKVITGTWNVTEATEVALLTVDTGDSSIIMTENGSIKASSFLRFSSMATNSLLIQGGALNIAGEAKIDANWQQTLNLINTDLTLGRGLNFMTWNSSTSILNINGSDVHLGGLIRASIGKAALNFVTADSSIDVSGLSEVTYGDSTAPSPGTNGFGIMNRGYEIADSSVTTTIGDGIVVTVKKGDTTLGTLTSSNNGQALYFNTRTGTGTTYHLQDGSSDMTTSAIAAIATNENTTYAATAISSGNTLTIDRAEDGGQLTSSTGDGNIILGRDLGTINAIKDSSVTGTLTISSGTILQIGNGNTTANGSVASFGKVVLNDGKIAIWHNKTTINGVTTEAGTTNYIKYHDSNANNDATSKLVLGGTTTVAENSKLYLMNKWKMRMEVANLAGTGTVEINGSTGSNSATDFTLSGNCSETIAAGSYDYTVDVSAGQFTGQLILNNSSAKLNLISNGLPSGYTFTKTAGTATLTTTGDIDFGSGVNDTFQHLVIRDGVTVTSSHDGSVGFIKGSITINGGGKLQITGNGKDAFGYSGTYGGDYTDSVALNGIEDLKKATLHLEKNGLTLSTNLTMNGFAEVTKATDGGSFNTFGGNITASGANNVISADIDLRKNATVTISDSSSLTISGSINLHGEAENQGTLTKAGGGVLTISGSVTGGTIMGDGANTIVNGSSTISGGTFNNVTLGTANTDGSNQMELQGGTFTGTTELVERVQISSGNTVTFGDINLSCSQSYIFKVDGTLKLNGTADISASNYGFGVTDSGKVEVSGDVTSKQVNWDNSNRGTIEVKSGGSLSLTGSGGNYLDTLTNEGNTSVTGALNVNTLNNSGTLQLAKENISIDTVVLDGGTVTLGTVDDHDAVLTTNSLTVSGASALNANLVLDGASLTLNDSLTMGSTLTLNNVNLTNWADLLAANTDGNPIVLFKSVDSLTLGSGDSAITAEVGTVYDASTAFSNTNMGNYKLQMLAGADGDHIVQMVTSTPTPEPTTATLSLLALMGLAARRRRRKA